MLYRGLLFKSMFKLVLYPGGNSENTAGAGPRTLRLFIPKIVLYVD